MKLRFSLACAVACLGLLLPGCSKPEALDYLPESQGYLTVNGQTAKEQAGMARMMKVMEKLSPETGAAPEMQRMYLGFDAAIGSQPQFYGVVTGSPGMADQMLTQLKSSGATDTTAEGMPAVRTPEQQGMSGLIVKQSDSAVLIASGDGALTKMVTTSKRKNPAAVNSPLFRQATANSGSHAVALTMNVAGYMEAAAPQLGMIAMMNPKGAEALKQVQTVSLFVDWAEQPKVALLASLNDPEARNNLAGLLNMGLQMAMAQPGAAVPDFVKGIKAETNTDGVQVELALPKETADEMLAKLEKVAADLPADPKEREKALQEALMGMIPTPPAGGGAPGMQPPAAPPVMGVSMQ